MCVCGKVVGWSVVDGGCCVTGLPLWLLWFGWVDVAVVVVVVSVGVEWGLT